MHLRHWRAGDGGGGGRVAGGAEERGGLFRGRVQVKCETPIYHPNIDTEGNVCLNILRKDWRPVLDMNAVIYGMIFLFHEPNGNDPLNMGTRLGRALRWVRGAAMGQGVGMCVQRPRASCGTMRPNSRASSPPRCAEALWEGAASPSSSDDEGC